MIKSTTERDQVVTQIKDRFPLLYTYVDTKRDLEKGKHLPTEMQLKPKTFEMLLSIVNKSQTLWSWTLTDIVSDVLNEYGATKAKSLYFGFILSNDDDKQTLFNDSAVAYVQFGKNRLPLEEAIVLFCLLIALEDDPLEIAPRSLSRQCKIWLKRYIAYLANRICFALN